MLEEVGPGEVPFQLHYQASDLRTLIAACLTLPDKKVPDFDTPPPPLPPGAPHEHFSSQESGCFGLLILYILRAVVSYPAVSLHSCPSSPQVMRAVTDARASHPQEGTSHCFSHHLPVGPGTSTRGTSGGCRTVPWSSGRAFGLIDRSSLKAHVGLRFIGSGDEGSSEEASRPQSPAVWRSLAHVSLYTCMPLCPC